MMQKTPNYIARGLMVSFAGFGVNMILGVLYSWSVISAALIDELGWTATQTQYPFMFACAFFAFSMIPAGKLQDKFGPKPVIMAAAVLCGLGFFMAGLTLSIIGMALFYGFIFGISMGLGYSAPTPAAIKWFSPAKRGLISGIVVSGFGLAPLYIAPIKSLLINRLGIQMTFYILGGFFFFIIMVLAQVINNPPKGYIPKGQYIECNQPVALKDYQISEVLKTSQFYLLWAMFCFGTFAGLLIIGQLAKIGLEQSGITTSFLLIAIYSLFNFLGRLFWGIISDKIGRQESLMLLFAIQVIVYLFFIFLSSPVLLIIAVSIVGLTFGGMLTVFPAITADYYGMKNFGLIYGFVISAWGVGGVLGPLIGGLVRDATGTYVISYIVSAALSCLGVVLSLAIKAPGRERCRLFRISQPEEI
jgi:MFS transporter, OFA family, oxalate/formate antiporter